MVLFVKCKAVCLLCLILSVEKNFFLFNKLNVLLRELLNIIRISVSVYN